MSAQARNISKTFRSFTALHDVNLNIESGEFVALLGPSGSGKTTLLRIIAGLEAPDSGSGSILLDGKDVSATGPGGREIGFVFQNYALFKHMTIFENIAFGLRVRPWSSRPGRRAIRARVRELLELMQLERVEKRYPSQISGGQQQRVALARALAIDPKFLLLDEPFGSLDAKVRQELRSWLRKLHDQVHITSLLVTHDQQEAFEIADRVVIMNRGQIEQIGTPDEVQRRPASPFVSEFLGLGNNGQNHTSCNAAVA
jgi:sulfate/thiosulfate transport system ATP-binding protein